MTTKKPVYNGYNEEYLTGKELKVKFNNEYLGVGRHHSTVLGISIPEYLTFLNIDDEKTYRIFVNDAFCRVMNGDNDKLVDFFCHNKIEDIVPPFNPEDVKLESVCPDCGSPMIYRTGRYGSFLGCSKYPNCKHTQNIPIVGEYK